MIMKTSALQDAGAFVRTPIYPRGFGVRLSSAAFRTPDHENAYRRHSRCGQAFRRTIAPHLFSPGLLTPFSILACARNSRRHLVGSDVRSMHFGDGFLDAVLLNRSSAGLGNRQKFSVGVLIVDHPVVKIAAGSKPHNHKTPSLQLAVNCLKQLGERERTVPRHGELLME